MYSPESVKWVWEVEHVEVKFVISKFTSILKTKRTLNQPICLNPRLNRFGTAG